MRMSMGKRVIVVASVIDDTNKVLSTNVVIEKEIFLPEKICQLGMSKDEQLQLAGNVQQVVLNEQAHNLNVPPYDNCPKCHCKIWKNGSGTSLFHGFYSDHSVKLNKWNCSSSKCDWSSNPSISSLYNDNISPELLKVQAELGATSSYRSGAKSLKLLAGETRKIFNHMRVRSATNNLGEQVEKHLDGKHSLLPTDDGSQSSNNCIFKLNSDVKSSETSQPDADELIVAVDGVHVHDADNKGHNYEAMVGKIYKPENLVYVNKSHNSIIKKQCIGSAKADEQATMKAKLINAAHNEGMTKRTRITGLADGAKNCWNIIKSLSPYCALICYILDWFHIAKYFKNVENKLPKNEIESLQASKKYLWNGEVNLCLLALSAIKENVSRSGGIDKLDGLITYIENNKEHIANYEDRANNGLPYSSQVAESTVEHYASARLKKSQKAQWSRQSAHWILQIRGAVISNEWDGFCGNVLGISCLKNAA